MEVRERELYNGLPCLICGTGPPLVVLSGLSAQHRNPTGLDRRLQLRAVQALTPHFTVLVTNRRPGLAPGTTMRQLADDVAGAVRHEVDPPVPLVGISTGGSIAQQVAMDHPELVSRLVLISTACRLSARGWAVQRRLAELTEAGRPRAGWAAVGPALATHRLGQRLLSGLMWLAGPMGARDDPGDMLATIRAEDDFDASSGLHRITAPTLIVAGARDGFYTVGLFRETARAIPDAQLLLYPRRGHLGVVTHRPAQQRIARFLTDTPPASPASRDGG